MAPEFGKPFHQLPLIPADVLKKHRVHEPLDTRFRSAARLLQALWREDRDLPIGSYVGDVAGSDGILTASANSPAPLSVPSDPAHMAYASLS
jgi:hypothetical protein